MTNNPTIDGVSLLPCPFCGGKPVKKTSSGDERDGYAEHVSYQCSTCGCTRGACGDSSKGGYADNSKVEATALEAWNTRALLAAPDPIVEAEESITIAQLQALICEADDFMYIMTGNETQKHLDAKYGSLAWEEAIVDLRARIATAALNGGKS